MDRKTLFSLFVSIASLVTPIATHAINFALPGAVNMDAISLAMYLVNIVFNIIWVVAVGFSVVMFIIAGFKYLTAQGDPSKVWEATRMVIYGAVGIGVMILSFSIVWILRLTIGA